MPNPAPPPSTASLSTGQARVLEKIALGAPLGEVLEDLARTMQGQHLPGALCAVTLLDESGQDLRVRAAPDLPPGYITATQRFPVGPKATLCGRAAYHRTLAVSADIAADENGGEWQQAALQLGLRAGWSAPIFSQAGEVLGCFATYYHEPREPQPDELEGVQVAAHLASLAIERARATEKQERTEEKYRAIFDQALDAIFIVDDTRRCVEANGAALELLAARREEIIGQPIDRFLVSHQTGETPDCAAVMKVLLKGGQLAGECAVQPRHGVRRQVSCRARANFLPGLHLCQMHDITGRKQTEDELRWTEQFYRTLIDTTNTGYIVNDAAGFVIDANAEYARLTGRASVDDVRGHHVLEWTAPHDLERNHAAVARCAAGEPVRNLELDYVDADGKFTPVEVNATYVQTADGPRLLALCRDISDRRQAQQELQSAQEALESRVRERTTELAHANAEIRARAHRQEAVAAFGWRALTQVEISALMQEGTELVCKTLGVEIASVMEHQEIEPKGAEKNNMTLRAACGLPREWIGQKLVSSHSDSLSGYVLRIRQPVIVENLAKERRFQLPPKLSEMGAVSGVTVVIAGGGSQPFGVMHAYSRRRRTFTPEDVHFLQSIANVLAEVVERRRAEEAGRRAQQEAERANHAKSEFLSRMSHELRTPLNAILGFGQLLEIENLAPGQHESVSQIIRAGRHLLEMVNEVLDIARIESGHLSMAPEPVAAGMLLREALELIRPLAKARRIELFLSTELEDSRHHLLADRQRFRQAVLNLLSNAVKYNREGGRVTVDGGLTLGGERLRMEITDTGEGIPPEKLARLFIPFDRLGAEESSVEGSGIGLALSKRLIEAQRGALGVESVLGKGCTFWIEMPLAAEPEPALLPAELLESLLPSNAEKGQAANRPAARQVLHIEDNESNRLLVELLLGQRPNVELVSAPAGQEGLKLARERLPDLILLDMHLPDIPGEEVLGILRAEEGTRHIPVVIISADAGGARVRQLRAAGADDYLTKPFNVGQFLRVLDQHLAAVAKP